MNVKKLLIGIGIGILAVIFLIVGVANVNTTESKHEEFCVDSWEKEGFSSKEKCLEKMNELQERVDLAFP